VIDVSCGGMMIRENSKKLVGRAASLHFIHHRSHILIKDSTKAFAIRN
jgi:hypothetical protein